MFSQQQQQQMKRQKLSSQLSKLPQELIELIFYYIPDDYMETYIDLPFIGKYAINRLYGYIDIISSESGLWEDRGPKVYESIYKSIINPKTLIQRIKDGNNGVCSYKRWRVNQFVQFCKTNIAFRPKIVHFTSTEQLGWLHEHYPQILNQLPRIDVSTPKYSSYIWQVGDFPKDYLHLILENKLSGDSLLFKPGWGENVKELELYTIGTEELPTLFPNLQRLRLAFVDLSKQPLPNLPSSLKFLQLTTYTFDRLDVSYLENLKQIVGESLEPLHRLDRFKFPLGIERIFVRGATTDNSGINIESLDSIQLYANLKEVRIGHRDIFRKTEIFSKRTTFPENLQKLEISLSQSDNNTDSNVPFATVGENLHVPNNLKALLLSTSQINYSPEQLVLPKSLKVLSILSQMKGSEKEEDWSSVTFPTALLELNLSLARIEGITFPNWLQNLQITTGYPIQPMKFLEFENLVQLKLGWFFNDEFVFKFPPSLKILEVNSNNTLKKVKVEAANLKSVQFSTSSLVYLGASTFQSPDSVDSLSLTIQQGIVTATANVFPPLLKELYLKSCKITSDILGELHLEAYKKLVKLDLSNNMISRLENNTFPISIEYLRMDDNPISMFSTPDVFMELINLRELSMARKLIMIMTRSRFWWRSTHPSQLASYFQSDDQNTLNFPSSLISLNLANNCLQKGMVEKLNFSTCGQLQELSLDANWEMTDVQILVDQLKSSSPDMVELLLDRRLREEVNEEGINFLSFS
ncbi:uncharacterized protein J8A68_000809 [[Candida] subhashii]|uniref:Uncharacterized protein n=1 Tax=[Candida] subhashii TaxID=561895 RepID=A0A8J5QSH1_9ASCO|nr:uncharacterized protein J8A68_000809 [[Candida] subhashii]KAG7665603.1 hypothetical protein J8A68_000809 [[Candida] subhashii]